jgi:hypothetical protein
VSQQPTEKKLDLAWVISCTSASPRRLKSYLLLHKVPNCKHQSVHAEARAPHDCLIDDWCCFGMSWFSDSSCRSPYGVCKTCHGRCFSFLCTFCLQILQPCSWRQHFLQMEDRAGCACGASWSRSMVPGSDWVPISFELIANFPVATPLPKIICMGRWLFLWVMCCHFVLLEFPVLLYACYWAISLTISNLNKKMKS